MTIRVLLLDTCIFLLIDLNQGALISPTSTTSDTEFYVASTSWATDSIICGQEICVIECKGSKYCEAMSVDASNSDKLSLLCEGERPCQSLSITSPPTAEANITCNGLGSCYSASFDVSSTSNVDLHCTTTTTQTNSGRYLI